MYSLNVTILYIHIHRHSLNLTLSIITYYVFRYTLTMGISPLVSFLCIVLIWLYCIYIYIYIYLDLVLTRLDHFSIFICSNGTHVTRLWYYFSTYVQYFTQREVLNFTSNTVLYPVCWINVLMVYSPLFINSIFSIQFINQQKCTKVQKTCVYW